MQEKVLEMMEKDMLSVLSHELRNCLALIQGNFQLIEMEHPDMAEVRQWSYIQEELDNMEELLQNTSLIRLNPRTRFKVGSLLAPLESVIEESSGQIETKKLVFRKIFGEGIVEAARDYFFDMTALKRVFWNLLKNAIEACTEGDEIAVEVTLLNLEENEISLFERIVVEEKIQKALRIEFSNNGSVVSEDVLSKIFEPEFTTKADGSGLGLPIAKQVLDEYGAKMEAKSEEGKTKIIVIFPINNLEL